MGESQMTEDQIKAIRLSEKPLSYHQSQLPRQVAKEYAVEGMPEELQARVIHSLDFGGWFWQFSGPRPREAPETPARLPTKEQALEALRKWLRAFRLD
jgi:hypothetical protein